MENKTDEIFIKIYSNCAVCLGKGNVESNFRNSNICPSCKGSGKYEQFIKINDFYKILENNKIN
jgi:DnaJ-class molecular chaperone